MTKEREIRKETNWLGDEKEIIYEDGQKVGEIHSEERGGFLGIGAERVDVEYDNSGREVSYTAREERGGILGIGAEDVQVTYDSDSHKEIEVSRVEERGGFMEIASRHTRVSRTPDGEEVAQTNYENRGGILGIGGERVRVRRPSNDSDKSSHSPRDLKKIQHRSAGVTQSSPSPSHTVKPARSNRSGASRTDVTSWAISPSLVLYKTVIGAAGTVGFFYLGQIVMFIGHKLTMPSHTAEGFLQTLGFIALGLIGALIWLLGFVLSIPLFTVEYFTGWCLAVAPGVSYDPEAALQTVSMCYYVD